MIDWLAILQACSENMKTQVRPLFGSKEGRTEFGRGAGGDIKKRIDLAAEDALFETLRDHKVSCTVISEESGIKEIGAHPSQFYVTADPVDGTTNAVRGLPFVDISLAVSKRLSLDSVETGLVADVLHDITYTAEKGKGAFKNRKKIKPSQTATLDEAVVGVDLSNFKAREVVNQLIRILETTRHLRHFGANALEICYVADGTTDAFIDLRGKLRVTDIAAAHLILLEAGGVIITPKGRKLRVPLSPMQQVSFVAAGNRPLYGAIRQFMKTSKQDT